jgi:acyl-CoA synthetase (AMP-forming)/AMP-acid ligase II
MNTNEFLEISSAIVPERTAISFDNNQISFQELRTTADRLANVLVKLGVKPGDRVSMLDINSPQVLVIYFACAKLDVIFIPLNYRAKEDELHHMLTLSRSSVIFVGNRYATLMEKVTRNAGSTLKVVGIDGPDKEGWLSYERLMSNSVEEHTFTPSNQGRDTTILLFTSGTTGFPKAVMLSHDSFSSYMLSSVDPADPDIEESNLICVPLYHIAGLQASLAGIYAGRTLVMMRQFEPVEWMRLVEKKQVQRSGVVPTMLKQILDHPRFCEFDLSSLKVISYGAAPMPTTVIKKAIKELPRVQFINAFGQTETASTITMLSPEDHLLEGSEQEIEKKLTRLRSVGKPLPDVEVKIFDVHRKEVSWGITGEVVCRSPRLMSGYWDDQEATQSVFQDGWLFTGDLGYRDQDGYIYLSGRSKDFIKRGGEMISPEEIERILIDHDEVDDAAVIGVPDDEWGERVRALIVLNPGKFISESSLIEDVHSKLASFKTPESIIFLDYLPHNHLGKILKRELREKYSYPIEDK